MKFIIPIYTWLLPVIVSAQDAKNLAYRSVSASNLVDTIVMKQNPNKPSILSGGFIDLIQTGQVNASARLFKLYIGERNKFQLPISIYTGVSANNFSRDQSESTIVSALINPVAGIFNMYIDGVNRIFGGDNKITSL